MRDYHADMKAAMADEYRAYKSNGLAKQAAHVAEALWNTYGVDVDGSRTPTPVQIVPKVEKIEPEVKADDKPEEPRQKRKYTRRQPLERADQKAPETEVEDKPNPRVGE